MPEQTGKSNTKPMGPLANCRVLEIGIAGFAECTQRGPAPCSHALPFGYCFLCTHPRVNDIIENTKKVRDTVRI